MRAQSCPTLYNPIDCNPPGSSVHGIYQARTLEWVAFPTLWDLPEPGTEPTSIVSPALAGVSLPTVPPRKPNSLPIWELPPVASLLAAFHILLSSYLFLASKFPDSVTLFCKIVFDEQIFFQNTSFSFFVLFSECCVSLLHVHLMERRLSAIFT